jgi:hypothetical protein
MSSNTRSISEALAPYASSSTAKQPNVVCFPEPFGWYQELRPDEKGDVVRKCLDAIDNRTSDPRDRWLQIIFAVADAGRIGCLGAREFALGWSQRGASWTTENDFDTAWDSFKTGGISVGTLLAMARDAGLDLSHWRDTAIVRAQQAANLAQGGTVGLNLTSLPTNWPRAVPLASLPLVPPKRQWLHGTDLIRGAVMILVAPGGRAKSTLLLTCALACASGRALLGSHVFGGPLRVLCLSTEDGMSEMALRIRAAMKHHNLTDVDLPGLYLIGSDRWGLPLLQVGGNGPLLDQRGLQALTAELDRIQPDVLIIDPLINIMGGVSANDNAAAALLMGQLAELAAKRRISVALAHHASKGRDPTSADSAMGAASFINLARIALAIEPLDEKQAGAVGLPPWEAKAVFRLVGTKQNFSPPSETDRWFRVVSVDMFNAEPPIYPKGDSVAVVEQFQPGLSGPAFPDQLLRDALIAIQGASPPLTASKRSRDRYAAPVIARGIAHHRGGKVSETEGAAVLGHLLDVGLVRVEPVKVPRLDNKGSDTRQGLVLTPAGEAAFQYQAPQPPADSAPPQSPQPSATSLPDDAFGEPQGSPAKPGGYGGNAGGQQEPASAGAAADPSADQSSFLSNTLSQNGRDASSGNGEQNERGDEGERDD